MYNISGAMAFICFCQLILKPTLHYVKKLFLDKNQTLSDTGLMISLALMALGACITDYIGLHAVFGAFMIGSIIPRGTITTEIVSRIQPLTVGLLLPLFFTYSGLNTKIGLLNTPYLWMVCGVVFITAVLGKGVACYGAARFSGLSQREAIGIGALMNSRGLMELIIINIGLQRGIITEELFATLVIMAVITTLMASPIFDLLFAGRNPQQAENQQITTSG
jgi:Kef-type K+ transport system membrane component KefB